MAVSTLKECVSGIKDILMCAICLEDVKEPRMLVCHHSFCTSCLNSIELTGAGFQQKLQCPICRKYSNVPRGIVSYLPMDCKLNELSEVHRQAARLEVSQTIKHKSAVSELVVCVVCARQTSNDFKDESYFYYCNNCHDYLCNVCSDTHKDIQLFKDHELICLVGKSIGLQRLFCLDHSKKYKDYHCEECKQLVCSVCVVNSHREHTVRPFEQHDKICRDSIYEQGLELWQVFHVPLYFMQGLFTGDITKPFLAHLNITTDNITKKISDTAKSITEDIERQRDNLTDLVKKEHSTIQKILNAHILNQRCEHLWGSKEPGVLLKEHQELTEKIKRLFKKNDDDDDDGQIPKLTGDSNLYVDFSPETQGTSIGSLRAKSLNEFISDNELTNKS